MPELALACRLGQGRFGPERLEIDQTVTAVTWKSWRRHQVSNQEPGA
jgi:hypothetical protein